MSKLRIVELADARPADAPRSPGPEVAGRRKLQRTVTIAAALLDAPVQIVAVTPTTVRTVAASPWEQPRPGGEVARALVDGDGSIEATSTSGTVWSGILLPLPTPHVRAVLCTTAPLDAPTRAVLCDLAALAGAALRLEQEQESADSLRQLLGDTSHDLRNPLTVLRAGLETLLPSGSSSMPDDATGIVTLAIAQTRRMTRMVDAMLALHGIDDAPEPVALDLRDVVTEVLESGRLAHQLVDLQLSLPLPQTPVRMSGQPDGLARLFTNLVTNAAVHGRGRVWVSLTDDRSWAHVCVEDDGEGMPARTALDGGERAWRPGGHGLGLVIARRIVLSHGGAVHHEPRPGGGTRVHVRLPLV